MLGDEAGSNGKPHFWAAFQFCFSPSQALSPAWRSWSLGPCLQGQAFGK